MTELRVEHFDGIPVVQPPSDVDAANAIRVREELTAHVHDGGELIVDLSDTRYLDSAAIDMLFRLSQRLTQRRSGLRLVIRPGSGIARVAEIVAISSAVPVYDDVEQALEAARRSRRSEQVKQ